MMTLEKFEEAYEVVQKVILQTKLVYSDFYSDLTGNKVYIKPENMQKTGAYKIRGAYYKISTLTDEERNKGLITASAGNHAQGVAYAAKSYGVKAVIVMPTTTPLVKVNRTKAYGAEVILYGDVYDEACSYALRLAEENGYTFIHPFDDLDVATGQGSIAMEIIKELPTVDIILVPKVETIADGTAVKTPGSKIFPYIKENIDEIITIDDNELIGAFLDMLENHKMLAENSGLLTVAALKHLKCKGKKVVPIISGGNMDVITFSSLVQHGLIERGRICTVSVLLPDKPGELTNVSKVIADAQGNIVKLEHNQFVSINRSSAVELIITMETFGHEHKEKIIKSLKDNGYNPKSIKPTMIYE